MSSPRGLGRAFAQGRPALVVYLMAGYPDRPRSLAALEAVAAAGADLIELGVPYTDPMADGPVIREAAEVARRAADGTFGLAEAIDLAAGFRRANETAPPVALMTYLNPVLQRGYERVAAELAAAGVDGTIVPDLPPDSPLCAKWVEACHGHDLDTVFLAAPTSTGERLRLISAASTGFLYVVSTTGVTGERDSVADDLAPLLARVTAARAAVGKPVLPAVVGFGISDAAQASEVARLAEGVVVGSACVKRQDDVADLAAFVTGLADAVHEAR